MVKIRNYDDVILLVVHVTSCCWYPVGVLRTALTYSRPLASNAPPSALWKPSEEGSNLPTRNPFYKTLHNRVDTEVVPSRHTSLPLQSRNWRKSENKKLFYCSCADLNILINNMNVHKLDSPIYRFTRSSML